MRLKSIFSCRAIRYGAACVATAMMLTAATAHADVIAYYDFDDASDASTALDLSGNEYDGELLGPAVFGADGSGARGGAGNRAIDLGNFNNGAVVNIPAALDGAFDSILETQDATILFWLQGGADEPQSQWTYFIGRPDNRLLASHAPWGNSNVYFDVGGCCSGSQRINTEIAPELFKDNWNHYAYIKDQRQTSIYINGELIIESPADAIDDIEGPITLAVIGGGEGTTNNSQSGLMDDFGVWDEALSLDRIAQIAENGLVKPPPFQLNGSGQTITQNFDSMGVGTGRLPEGWEAEDFEGLGKRLDSLGLNDGPMNFPEAASIQGVVNVGGNPDNFASSDGTSVATWNADLTGDGVFNADDAKADAAVDRALGLARVENDEPGNLRFSVVIADKPLRAFTFDWDVEAWGGDPDGEFRGADGPGIATDLTIGGTSYYSHTETVAVGDTFDSAFDGTNNSHDPTLIDGNAHSSRGLGTGGVVEVSGADGAVGNMVNIVFDADWGGEDGGWTSAIDNVQFRAVAAGDVDGNGSVDPLDIVELLKGGQFGKGVNGVTWQQGDFNGDDQFDPNDLVAVLTFLSGEFPTTYASEQGNPGDGTPDVLVDPSSGEVVIDFAGHVSSSIIIDSAAGIFNGDAPAWDTMGEFRTASANQLSNTMFSGTESGVDNLGNLLKAQFMDSNFDFLGDLTVKILVATPDGPVTVDGHVIVVPEPSTWMLLGLGSLAVAALIRRRR